MMQKPKRMDPFFRLLLRFALLLCLMVVPAAQVIYGAGIWSSCTGLEGGQIYDLAINPQNPSIVYASAGYGGVYRSTNGGISWSDRRSGFAFTVFYKLAIDPQNPATLYAATLGSGVLKSTDEGASWNDASSGLGDTNIATLAIDPQNTAILYAGTYGGGVFKSTNGGTSWSDANNGLSNSRIWAFAIDPQNTAILYAGTYGGGVFKSTDGGQNWIAANNGLNVTVIYALAIDPQSPATVYVATYDSANGTYPNHPIKVFKSTNAGGSWSDTTNGLQVYYLWSLAIDPQNPARIYASTGSSEVYESTDSGTSWNRIYIGPGGPDGTYVVRAVAIDPQTPATLYAGTYSGVYKSIDSGSTWITVNNNLTATSIQTLTIDPANPATIYAGTNSGVYKSIDACLSWSAANSGLGITKDVVSMAIDLQNPTTIYTGARNDVNGELFKSTDGGASWSRPGGLLPNTVYALAIDPQTPATVYAGTRSAQPFFRSIDGGANWQSISNDYLGSPLHYREVWSLAINSQNPPKVYAAANESIYVLTSSLGWYRLYNGTSNVRALAIDPQNPATIYAGNWNGVLKSTNSGATWNPANIGLRNLHIMALAIDPQNAANIYAATWNGGVFRSTDGGASWEDMNSGLTDTNIAAMAITQTSLPRVYIGIAGGAIWAYDVPSIPSSSITITTNPSGRGYQVDGMSFSATYTFSWRVGSIHTISIPTPQGPGLGERYVFLNWSDGGASSHTITIPSSATTYTANLADQYLLTTYTSPQNSGTISANPASVDGFYDSGESVELTAIPNSGYHFSSWSGVATGLMNPVSVTMYAPRSVTATFLPNSSSTSDITITTNPPGLSFTVDGIYYATPQTFSWIVGNSHAISTTTPQVSGGGRYSFSGWSDGGAISHTITVPASATTYTAGLTAEYQLTTSVSPQNGGTINVNPTSSDGYYASSASVELTAVPNTGYLFTNWSGDLTGSTNPASVVMSAPRSVTAVFLPVGTGLSFSLNSGGAAHYSTAGTAGTTRVGYASLIVSSGPDPYATGVFSFKQNGFTVTEAGVPASPPTYLARIFIDYRAHVLALPGQSNSGYIDINTGIAVVNTGDSFADVAYTLRDNSGNTLALGNGTIAAGAHFAKFINQLTDVAPNFSLPADFQSTIQFGSLEISSDQPLSVLALRGTNNQRNDFLITTTPVADLWQGDNDAYQFFPQFADGGGYTTSLILLNTGDITETGKLQILRNDGSPLVVHPVGGTSDSLFAYSIPAGGAFHFQTDGFPANVSVGWARLIPDSGSSTPVGFGIFSYNPGPMLISESGIPSAMPTGHARVFVDLSGNHNTGLAIANIGNSPSSVTINAYQMDGVTPAGSSYSPFLIPSGMHVAQFANQFIRDLPIGFMGVLDVSSTLPIAALTIRALVNERNDFLMTTFPVANALYPAPSPIYFPQIADGGGYTTEFILLSPQGASIATLGLYDENGNPTPF